MDSSIYRQTRIMNSQDRQVGMVTMVKVVGNFARYRVIVDQSDGYQTGTGSLGYTDAIQEFYTRVGHLATVHGDCRTVQTEIEKES